MGPLLTQHLLIMLVSGLDCLRGIDPWAAILRTHAHTHAHKCVRSRTCTHTSTHMHTDTVRCTYRHIYCYTHICTHTHTTTHACTHTHAFLLLVMPQVITGAPGRLNHHPIKFVLWYRCLLNTPISLWGGILHNWITPLLHWYLEIWRDWSWLPSNADQCWAGERDWTQAENTNISSHIFKKIQLHVLPCASDWNYKALGFLFYAILDVKQ